MAADRGKDIAAPLKQALAETPGLTVVRIVPRSTNAALKLGYGGRGMSGQAFVRGEVLFVGFNPSTFDPEGMNRKIEEVAEKITEGQVKPYHASLEPSGANLGNITLVETLPSVKMRRTDTYSTDDPDLANLLLDAQGVQVGKRNTRVVSFATTRTSEAVFYPSESVASFAADLKYAIEKDEIRGFNGVRVPIHHDFAMAKLEWHNFKKLAETPVPQEALQELAEFHRIPNYVVPNGPISPWFEARRGS